jgi:hypothetical protein
VNPSLQHNTTLKRILWYLSRTRIYSITYTDIADHPNICHGFSDAMFANDKTWKSIAGYIFLAAKGAITWQSKRQTLMSLSLTEAEYIALSEALCEAHWL